MGDKLSNQNPDESLDDIDIGKLLEEVFAEMELEDLKQGPPTEAEMIGKAHPDPEMGKAGREIRQILSRLRKID